MAFSNQSSKNWSEILAQTDIEKKTRKLQLAVYNVIDSGNLYFFNMDDLNSTGRLYYSKNKESFFGHLSPGHYTISLIGKYQPNNIIVGVLISNIPK